MRKKENPEILVCDDEKLVRRLYQQYFRRNRPDLAFGFALNGKEALNKIRASHFKVLITDLNMPEMDGVSLLEHIRHEGFGIVSIVVTAYGDELRNQAFRAGCFQLLNKPIDFPVLSVAIDNSIREYCCRYDDDDFCEGISTEDG